MTRAERRRAERAEKKKTVTYNFTPEQAKDAINRGIEKELERVRQEAFDDAVNTAMVLLLYIPLYVLLTKYWKKSGAQRLPKLTEDCLEVYEKWQKGEIEMKEMQDFVWDIGGVKLEEAE